MKIAVMQPYIFPYIGYFQMIHAVDKFVFYDDVNFIKQGWINRNRVLVSGKDYLFTIPIENASSFATINETHINLALYDRFKTKFLQTLGLNYKKAPYFPEVISLVEQILESPSVTIAQLAIKSIVATTDYLEMEKQFCISSEVYQNKGLDRYERLIDICKREKATQYINAIGGQDLYRKEDFEREGIQLNFIKTLPIAYKQFKNEFVPWLSIIDVLMFNSKQEVKDFLNNYELI